VAIAGGDTPDPDPSEQFRKLQEQQARIQKLINPPGLQQLRQLQEQSARIQKLINPPGLQQLRQLEEQQARLQALFENPVVSSLSERRAEWNDLLTPEAITEIDSFQADLANRVVASGERVAEAGEAEVEGVWFGAASWATLLAEIEGLLKAMEVITSAMTASKMALHAPVPTAILALLIVLISATEFALWLAKQELGA
jgi:hypothetical protein